MPGPSAATPPPALRRALRGVRGRMLAQHALNALLVTLAAAFAGAALGSIMRWSGLDVDPRLAAGGLALVVLIVYAQRVAREPWSAARLTRRIEQRMGWQEQLSSALETPPHASVIAAALHKRVATLCSGLEPRRVAPWAWPGRLLAVVAVSGLGVLAAEALPHVVPMPAPHLTATGAPDADATDPAITTESLLRLADAVEADAQRRFDPYLSGVAEALRDLADDIERAALASDDVRPSLDAVLEHLARAYGTDVAGSDLAERLLAAQPSRDPQGTADDDEAGLDTLRFSAAELGSDDLERVLQAAEEPPPSSDPAETGAGRAPPPGTQMTGYGSQELRDIAEARRQQGGDTPPGPGELVGAADDADAGASRVAGRGSQALEGEALDLDAESAVDDVMAVRGRERDDGRRIDVELASAVGWDDYDAGAFRTGAWVATPEPHLITDTSDPRYRPVLGRYFVPSHETVNHARRDDP